MTRFRGPAVVALYGALLIACRQAPPAEPAAQASVVRPEAGGRSGEEKRSGGPGERAGNESAKAGASAGGRIAWRPLGSWSGRSDAQTESFTSETGSFRIKWESHPAAGAENGAPETSGGRARGSSLIITLHSAISGRPLAVAVDHAGAGEGVAFVREDPRDFFATVESSATEWSFSIEEGVGVP